MVMVNLRGVYLNAVDDPSDRLELREAGELTRVPSVAGEVRRGAGGRVRLFTRAGRTTEWSLTVDYLLPQQVAWLEDHVGQVVCARDNRGHKVFGTYLSLEVGERVGRHRLADVSLTISELTFSEAI